MLPGDFLSSIAKGPLNSVTELLHKAQKCMNVKDVVVIAKEMTNKRKRDERTNHHLEKKKKETQSPK